jgi:hypothetical protein
MVSPRQRQAGVRTRVAWCRVGPDENALLAILRRRYAVRQDTAGNDGESRLIMTYVAAASVR